MNKQCIINEKISEKFNDINSKLYNFKHSIQLFVDCLEDNDNVSVNVICLAIILKEYFEQIKQEYTHLLEILNILE